MSYTKEITSCGIKVKAEFFNSCNELVKVCDERTHRGGRFDNTREEARYGFSGVHNFDEARSLLSDGWQEKVKDLEKKINGKVVTNDGKRISFHNDVQGFAPVVPLALQGVPTSMINTYIKPMKTKIINVYYDMTCKFSTDKEDIMRCGLKLVSALVDLELKGYRINLYTIVSFSDDRTSDILFVKIKDSKQPFALQRMMFPIAHPAFFRTISFDWYERFPKSTYRSGYGKAIGYIIRDNKSRFKNFSKEVFGDGVMFLMTELLDKSEDHIKGVLTNNGKNKD